MNTFDVRVTTAMPLDAAEKQAVLTKLSEQLQKPSLTIEFQVDSALLCGIRIEHDGARWDIDALDQLQVLKARLMKQARETAILSWSDIGNELRKKLEESKTSPRTTAWGKVLSIGDGVVQADGLKDVCYGELVIFASGAYGMAMNLETGRVGIMLLNGGDDVVEGMDVTGTGKVFSVPVGASMLGRIVNPLGMPIDGKGPISTSQYRPIEYPAPKVFARKPVDRPLQTGTLSVDAMVPIGRGQRELIIGDRQTGKTTIAIDAILNQKDTGVLCVYVAIGQKASNVGQIYNQLLEAGAMEYTMIVCATASDSAPMQYIAPYAGCAMAEAFMYEGRDVLIVYDDLSKHAVAYRTISLLLRRPPGREAYPGDVFYLHSRLLERAAQLSDEFGGGSMTALPIVETMAGDISAYIPTNVISITDGQIFIESELFNAGMRPAINVGLSVSRVGSSAQTPAMKQYSKGLRLDLAQYRELAVFSQFGSDLDASTRARLSHGEKLMDALKQPQGHPLSLGEEIARLYAVAHERLIPLKPADIPAFLKTYESILRSRPGILQTINRTGQISSEALQDFDRAIDTALSQMEVTAGA